MSLSSLNIDGLDYSDISPSEVDSFEAQPAMLPLADQVINAQCKRIVRSSLQSDRYLCSLRQNS